jgi:diguanylate cyclase (GGDEF)-like protein/PAS domain S-box-containing protein
MVRNQVEDYDGADRARVDSGVVTEQIRLLVHRRLDLPINLLNATIVSYALWRLFPAWLVVSWLGVFTAVILARVLIRHLYRRAEPGPESALRWGNIFTVNALATGCVWGFTGSVILLTPNPLYHLFILFVLGGMMAGGIVSNAAYKPAMLASMLPTILPAIAILVSRRDLIHGEMGVLLAAFTAVLIVTGRNINQSIVENFRLRIAQEILLAKLSVSEAVMAEAQEMAHVGSWDVDLVAKTYVCSIEASRIFGIDLAKPKPAYEEMLARIHPDDQRAVGDDITETVSTRKGRGIDHRLVMEDGTIKYVHELGRVTCDAEGRPLRMTGTVEDITSRRIAEDKLKFANILLRTEMEASPDGILVVDSNRRITSFNRRFADIWNVPLNDLLAGNDAVVLKRVASSVKEPEEFKARVDYLFAHPGEGSHDVYETTDGRFIDRYTETLTTPGGEHLGRVWFFRDITERRHAASELAYRDCLLHAVTVSTGILVKAESLDQGMPESLRIVGESMNVDRVLVMQEGPNRRSPPALRYVWQIPGIATPFDMSTFQASAAEMEALSAWRVQMTEGEPLIAQFATSEGPIRAMLESYRNLSTLLVPIFVGGKLWGNLAIDSCRVAREWTGSEIDLMKTFGDIAGASIVHDATRLSLETSEERFRVLGATAADAIIMIDGAGRISYWNRSAERILGYSAEEAVGKPVHGFLVPARLQEKASQGLKAFIQTGQGPALGKITELAALRKDGTEIPVELSLSGARVGSEWQAIGILRDITKNKQATAHALRMARFDELTGLANRSVFVDALQHAIAIAKRGEMGFSVLYLDLDHFKDVNDTLGHPVGDSLLQEVAERLQANTREVDTVARFGGDEFAVVVSDAGDPADAAILADRLISSLGKPYSIQGNDIYSGASMGIDLYGPDACDAETLLSHADIALYRAKSEGRGGYRFFTEAMDAEVRLQVSLGTELHQALDSGQLYLVYQPQVAIDSARVIGVEALVRWRHPQRGILGPGRFIPAAEKTGIIVKLGHWVLRTACRQAREWLDAGIGIGRIAVNISAVQFRSPIALEADIAAILAETGLPPQLLELELTETVLMSATREHGDIILRLRKLGVTIAIDDFGTGYSSLDYLRRFPADRIKIAQNFVQHLESMPSDVSIVRATIGLARELGISVIAEGVETLEQLELLKEWGCKEVQGFYFAKPLAEDDITLLLRNGGILHPETELPAQKNANRSLPHHG